MKLEKIKRKKCLEMLNFEGRKIIVTGAGKGIGKGLTQKLVELGAHVVAISRTKSDVDALSGELGDRNRLLHL